jgi:hypothetical protein
LAVYAKKLVRIPDSFEEERHQTLRVIWRAVTGHNLGRVSNVRFVVQRIKGTIPATRKHQFKTDAVSAIGVKVSLVGQEVTIERAFRGLGVIKAVESQSGLAEEGLGVVRHHVPEGFWDVWNRVCKIALIGITSNHCEISRKGDNIGFANIGV